MQPIYNMIFPELNSNSKVWIYTADRKLESAEIDTISKKLEFFISEWAAHGNELFGNATILHDYFIVLAVDESKVMASGCSIDSSVRFIKELGNTLEIDFLNRFYVITKEQDLIDRVHLTKLSEKIDSEVFNPMITTLGQLNSEWLIPVKSSPFV